MASGSRAELSGGDFRIVVEALLLVAQVEEKLSRVEGADEAQELAHELRDELLELQRTMEW